MQMMGGKEKEEKTENWLILSHTRLREVEK